MARTTAVAVLLLVAVVCAAAQDAATLTVQFNNRAKRVIEGSKRQKVLDALADNVFLVPRGNVAIVSGLDQSGILSRQSVVTFKAVGPTRNRVPVVVNCQKNTRGFLLFRSRAAKAVKKATDTWWPRDAVRIQKATCQRAARR